MVCERLLISVKNNRYVLKTTDLGILRLFQVANDAYLYHLKFMSLFQSRRVLPEISRIREFYPRKWIKTQNFSNALRLILFTS